MRAYTSTAAGRITAWALDVHIPIQGWLAISYLDYAAMILIKLWIVAGVLQLYRNRLLRGVRTAVGRLPTCPGVDKVPKSWRVHLGATVSTKIVQVLKATETYFHRTVLKKTFNM